MKNLLFKGLLGATLLSAFTSSALAVAIGNTGTANNRSGSFQSGSGGEFYFQVLTGGTNVNNGAYALSTRDQGGKLDSFQTFCLEKSENIGGSGITYVVNDRARNGGGNTPVSGNDSGAFGDVISVGTAWLYSQFALGSVGNYFTASNRTTEAGKLQNAIWALEDEINDSEVSSNPYYQLAVNYFTSLGQNAEADNTAGGYGVWVLNNTKSEWSSSQQRYVTVKKQDMLFFAGGASTVPDGGSALILLGLGLSGLSLFSRFKRQATSA